MNEEIFEEITEITNKMSILIREKGQDMEPEILAVVAANLAEMASLLKILTDETNNALYAGNEVK